MPLGLGSAHLTPALSLQKGRAPQPQISFRNRRRGGHDREEGKEGENKGTNEAPSSKMSTKRRRTGQSSSRSGAAREPPPQQLLPDDIEKENAAVLDKLPREVWEKIVLLIRGTDRRNVGREELGLFSFAMTCRYFRDLRQRVNASTELKTLLRSYSYIEETSYESPGGVRFCPTINECKYPLLPLIRLCLLFLTLFLAQSMNSSSSSLLTI